MKIKTTQIAYVSESEYQYAEKKAEIYAHTNMAHNHISNNKSILNRQYMHRNSVISHLMVKSPSK